MFFSWQTSSYAYQSIAEVEENGYFCQYTCEGICVCMCKTRDPQKLTGSANFAQSEWYVSLPAAFWLSPWKHTSDWGSEIAVVTIARSRGLHFVVIQGNGAVGLMLSVQNVKTGIIPFEELSTGLWIIA